MDGRSPPASVLPAFRAHMLRGSDQARQGNFAAAADSFRAALAVKPDSALACMELADSLRFEYDRTRQRACYAEAHEAARRAVTLAPESAAAHSYLAHFLASFGRPHEAKEHIDKAIALEPLSPLHHARRANMFRQQKKYRRADRVYRKALLLNPQDTSALIGYALFLFFTRNSLKKAEKYTQRLLQIAPDHHGGVVLMGHILFCRGKIEAATEHARLALSKVPDNGFALQLQAAIETRHNPFKGLGLRLRLCLNRPIYRILAILGFLLLLLTMAVYNSLPLCLGVSAGVYLIYLISNSGKFLNSHFRQHYLQPQELREDF